MPPKSKSIFRQPGSRHFQLVHRSQRDPLIHDPEASQHVLKEVERGNQKGKSRADLEDLIAGGIEHERPNVGEASLYGIYYDDTAYDYMQHLRPVGVHEEGVESVLIDVPLTKPKGKSKAPIELKDIPSEALPSTSELPRDYEAQEAIPSSIAGFQPDLNPHLRQTLEALEDDAFVDDEVEDDFFGELLQDGELENGEELDYEFHEDGVEESSTVEQGPSGDDHEELEDDTFEARFARFKKEQSHRSQTKAASDLDSSEGGDTVGQLPQLSVIGGKRRHKGSDATGYSMSSSSMTRNDALMTLDQRFDQIIAKEYGSDEEEDDEEDNDDISEDSDEAPELITTREDFESLMDDFLNNHEVVGRKLKPVLPGDTAAEKLDTLRRAIGVDSRVGVDETDTNSDEEILMPYDPHDKKDRWDCETILSTYSNLENHPRLIRVLHNTNVKKIHIDPKSGKPSVQPQPVSQKATPNGHELDGREPEPAPRPTVSRDKNESKEEKKARKSAVKAERQARRVDKKAKQEQFSSEFKHQARVAAFKESAKTRKL